MRTFYYNKKGEPIASDEWVRLLEDPAYQRIKQTVLPNGKWVSTVWLGLNYQYGNGPPLVFETMVFSRQGEWDELDCRRYSTIREARIGHKEMVKEWGAK